jgi:hypothetical protein
MTVTASETTTNTRVQAIFTDVLDSLLGIIRKHQVLPGEVVPAVVEVEVAVPRLRPASW